MLIEALHKIAANPWIYDRIQILAGQERVLARLSREVVQFHPKVVVDIGGGTGTVRGLLSANCRYVCLDLEMPKLTGFRAKFADGLAILGDATAIPISDGSADLVICKSVTHHLTEPQLEKALDESYRVLRPGGHMVLLDAVLNKQRLAGLALWKLDRGSYPRLNNELRARFSGRFQIVRWDKFAIYHEYVLGVGMRP
jgi:ubiquinone/menaquinone biosynthesis C-methylase UbiE